MHNKVEDGSDESLGSFEREKEAYAHFLQYGACSSGAVPMCFGWVRLTKVNIASMLHMPALSDVTRSWIERLKNPMALLLEHFPVVEQLSISNITEDVSDRALKALYSIHASYVAHGAISWRNVIIVPRKTPPIPDHPLPDIFQEVRRLEALANAHKNKIRVVWYNFDVSVCCCRVSLKRRNFFDELQWAWGYFYRTLVSWHSVQTPIVPT
jgi:hypothetical protein